MNKTSPDGMILQWLQNRVKLVIEENNEYYITLEYAKNKYMYRFGDSITRQDTEVREMPEIEALEYIKAYYKGRARSIAKLNLRSPEEIWNYINEHP